MTHGSLFSGIGGFDLAAEWMGWENIFHCEWEDFPKRVLNYYWPNAISYDDITKTDFTIHRGKISILTGGFPCQPYSAAGKRLGKEDDRHLWPEMLRAIREIQPCWVVGENVLGLTNWNGGLVFEEVQADLEAEGYQVQPFILPAAAVNAPHRRDRVWFVAYSDSFGMSKKAGKDKGIKGEGATNNESGIRIQQQTDRNNRCIRFPRPTPDTDIDQRCKRRMHKAGRETAERHFGSCDTRQGRNWENFPTQSPVRSGDDGLPERLDGITFPKWRNESIKAYGNAIVPQVVHQIFKAIEQYDRARS